MLEVKSRLRVAALAVGAVVLSITAAASSTTAVSAVDTTTSVPADANDAPVDVPIARKVAAADAPAPATRGSSIQETPTLPPPPTEEPTTTIAQAPPDTGVPNQSGAGRRIIYSKNRMRVWIIDGNEALVSTYRVSGRFGQPSPGTYHVFSRSEYTCNIDHSNVCMRFMVRFARGPKGDNIGFHEIPKKNGVPIEADWQLGQALSGGCVRQSTADAIFMWGFGSIGTTVVVVD